MQFVIENKAFSNALAIAASILPTKTQVPILAHLLVDVGADNIRLRATDTNMEVSVPVPAETSERGVFTVDGKLLLNIVKRLPKGGQSSVSLEDHVLRVICGKSKFSLMTLPSEDWPSLTVKEVGALATFEISSSDLRLLFERVQFAVCTDEARYYLTGVYLHARVDDMGERLCAVATDGKRLGLQTVKLPAGAAGLLGDDPNGVIVPRATVAEILKMFPASDADLEVNMTPNIIRINLGGLEIVSRLMDGTYPDYQRVIPEGGVCAVVPRESFAQAVGRVGTVLDGDAVGVSLAFSGDAVTIKGKGSVNTAEEDVDGCVHDGVFSVGVNAKYLGEMLSAMPGAQIAVKHGNNAAYALKFEPVDGDGSQLMVLMPMRVGVGDES